MAIALVTDSTSGLSSNLDAGVVAVPLHVIIDGRSFTDGVDISPVQVAQALRSGAQVSTSRCSVEAMAEAYAHVAERGFTQIVSVHLSAGLSATHDAAVLAARAAAVPVHVVDSQQVGRTVGFLAGEVLDARSTGLPVDQVVARIQAAAGNALSLVAVDDLTYARRGGRVGAASSAVATALALKPILGMRGGSVEVVAKVRTMAKSCARLADLALDWAQPRLAAGEQVEVAVHHLDSQERADEVAQLVQSGIGASVDVGIGELDAVLGVHGGPGSIAIFGAARTPLP